MKSSTAPAEQAAAKPDPNADYVDDDADSSVDEDDNEPV